ncbi:MAG: 50S ribosomal protein L32 [Holosporaceae bacterium]|jgi:large subunit ribosomal protein L32|nr:50S ribosomal protein L32 [Holosporaceae bacterium]
MAVPKKKISKSRRDMRRSHLALKPVNSVACLNCGESRLPHHMCNNCGMYNGKQILKDKRPLA